MINDIINAVKTALNNPKDLKIGILVFIIIVFIGLITGWIQKFIDWLFIRSRSKNEKNIYRLNIKGNKNKTYQAGRDIKIVKQHGLDNKAFVDIEMESFTGAPKFELKLTLSNTGKKSVNLQQIQFCGEKFPLVINALKGKGKSTLNFNLPKFKIITKKLIKPQIVLIYKDVRGKVYKTIAGVIRESRNDGKFNITRLTNIRSK